MGRRKTKTGKQKHALAVSSNKQQLKNKSKKNSGKTKLGRTIMASKILGTTTATATTTTTLPSRGGVTSRTNAAAASAATKSAIMSMATSAVGSSVVTIGGTGSRILKGSQKQQQQKESQSPLKTPPTASPLLVVTPEASNVSAAHALSSVKNKNNKNKNNIISVEQREDFKRQQMSLMERLHAANKMDCTRSKKKNNIKNKNNNKRKHDNNNDAETEAVKKSGRGGGRSTGWRIDPSTLQTVINPRPPIFVLDNGSNETKKTQQLIDETTTKVRKLTGIGQQQDDEQYSMLTLTTEMNKILENTRRDDEQDDDDDAIGKEQHWPARCDTSNNRNKVIQSLDDNPWTVLQGEDDDEGADGAGNKGLQFAPPIFSLPTPSSSSVPSSSGPSSSPSSKQQTGAIGEEATEEIDPDL